jgi:UDP-glucose 4-epimerase
MEKIIVTGANGFIGRNFIKYAVSHGIEVYAVDINHEQSTLKELKYIHFIECDMQQMELLIDLVPHQDYLAFYHFAWSGVASSNLYRKSYEAQINNIKYSCDAALVSKKLNCKKFITTGSIVEKATKNILNSMNITESYYYGIAKNCYHEYLGTICEINKINYIWVVLPNIYGGDSTTIISYMLNEFKNNRIPTFGPCQQLYNFTYIKDIVRGLLFLGEVETLSGEYLLSNGECRKSYEFLQEASKLFSKEIQLGVRNDDGLIFQKEWFDNEKLIQLGFKPKYNFIDGIKEMYEEMLKG